MQVELVTVDVSTARFRRQSAQMEAIAAQFNLAEDVRTPAFV